MAKTKTYLNEMMKSKIFRDKFDNEYKNICLGEKIAKARHKAGLSQKLLADKIHTTKSAVSRYESDEYEGYTVGLLNKIANACDVGLSIRFACKKKK